MVGELGIRALTCGIANEVHPPSNKELSSQPQDSSDGGITKGLPEFFLQVNSDACTLQVLLLRIKSGQTAFLAGLGDENLVTSEMGGLSVMLGMSDPP